MFTDSDANAAARERLSALVDGELDGAALPQACAQWRENEPHRASWHAWHLIGDVLRSEDLAQSPSRDATFLAGFRARLVACGRGSIRVCLPCVANRRLVEAGRGLSVHPAEPRTLRLTLNVGFR